MTQLVTNASPVFYTAEAVVNADHTITGSNGRMVMYSGLTAARVLTLPPATQMMQTIMVMDEDGSCDLTNSITLTCAGTDKIEGNSTRILNYPYSALTIESNGSGSWTVVANPNPSLSAGIQIAPTFADNGDGSITFTSGLYCFYTNSTGIGKIKRFTLPGNTFTLTDNTNQYIVADYNSGSPAIYVTTNVAVIDEITVIPLYTVYRRGTILHVLEWDSLGDALGNKTHKSIVKTQRFRTEPGGLGLGETATRLVTVGSGTVWHGAVSNALSAFNSSVNTMWLAYHVAGVWTFSTITQYNNTQYDDGTNLQTLPGGKYAVNFVYRIVGTNDTMTIVFLGQGAYSLGQAQESQPPADLPGEVLSHAILVGRIIVDQGGTTATQIDSAFTTLFTPGGVTDHEALLNLLGAGPDHYHPNAAEYAGTGTGNFVRLNAPTVTGMWTFLGSLTTPSAVVTSTSSATSQNTAPLVSGGIAINSSSTSTSGVDAGIWCFETNTPSASSTSIVYGAWFEAKGTGAYSQGALIAQRGDAIFSGSSSLSSAQGFQGNVLNNGSGGTIANAVGASTIFTVGSTNTITTGKGLSARSPIITSGGVITNNYGLYVEDQKPVGVTNGYAIYVASQGAGSYAFFSAGVGLFKIGDTTASTSPTTGALVVSGGIGCGGSIHSGTTVSTGVYTVATLPTGSDSMRAFVSDATATTFASAVVGGGTNHVPVYYDGGTSSWKIG